LPISPQCVAVPILTAIDAIPTAAISASSIAKSLIYWLLERTELTPLLSTLQLTGGPHALWSAFANDYAWSCHIETVPDFRKNSLKARKLFQEFGRRIP
jgi:hypothetical protein